MLKKIAIAAAAVLICAPALADGGRWEHRPHWKHWKHHHHSRPVVVVPAPHAYYAPPPRVYYAPPPRVYYAPPAPVYYAPPPVVYPAPASGVSIRLHFPL